MNASIREATAADMQALIELLHESDVFHRDAVPEAFARLEEPVRTEPYVDHLLNEENGTILVAELEGRVAGMVQLAVFERQNPRLKEGRYAVVGDVVVTDGMRRRGLGRMLMAAAQEWAAARGAEELELSVWDFNQAAIAFYESLGYRTGRRIMARRNG